MPARGRLGVLADIHANLPALDATIAAVERHGVDRWICAGDVVGYGAEPGPCIDRLRELGATCVAGNHDLMVVGDLPDDRAPRMARAAVRWTRDHLRPEDAAWLHRLPLRAAVGPIVVAHGTLDDPERYVLTATDAAAELQRLAPGEELLVLGHTHHQLAVAERSGRLSPQAGAPTRLPAGERVALNPGAIGQSREQALLASALVLDLDARAVQFLGVLYDVERARAALRASGLDERALHRPPPSAWRLAARRARDVARHRAAHAWRAARR